MYRLLLILFCLPALTVQQQYEKVITGELEHDVLTTDPELKLWCNKGYEEYKLETAHRPMLSSQLANKQVTVVLGTWCSDSQHLLPQLMKLLDEIQYPVQQLTLYGIDKEKKTPADIVTRYKITNVPTVIISDSNEREIGRITETPVKSLEEDLASILAKQ